MLLRRCRGWIDFVAHDFRCDLRFFGTGESLSRRRLWRFCLFLVKDHARLLAPLAGSIRVGFRLRRFAFQLLRDQDVLGAGYQGGHDGGDLAACRRLLRGCRGEGLGWWSTLAKPRPSKGMGEAEGGVDVDGSGADLFCSVGLVLPHGYGFSLALSALFPYCRGSCGGVGQFLDRAGRVGSGRLIKLRTVGRKLRPS
jgi:hypothetical protein